MSIRSRDDSVKPGRGIDGSEGENFTRNSQDPLTVEPHCAAPERSYSRLSDDNGGDKWAEYGVNQDQLRNKRDFMFRSLKRDIWADAVEGNGEENGGHSGPIRYGVNKSQGSKY